MQTCTIPEIMLNTVTAEVTSLVAALKLSYTGNTRTIPNYPKINVFSTVDFSSVRTEACAGVTSECRALAA